MSNQPHRIPWIEISLDETKAIRTQATEIANLFQFIYTETEKTLKGEISVDEAQIPSFDKVDHMALLHALKASIKDRITEFQYFFISHGAEMDERAIELEQVRKDLRRVLTKHDLNILMNLKTQREALQVEEKPPLTNTPSQRQILQNLIADATKTVVEEEERRSSAATPPRGENTTVGREPTPRMQSPSPQMKSPRSTHSSARQTGKPPASHASSPAAASSYRDIQSGRSQQRSARSYNPSIHESFAESYITTNGADVSSHGFMNESTEDLIQGLLSQTDLVSEQRYESPQPSSTSSKRRSIREFGSPGFRERQSKKHGGVTRKIHIPRGPRASSVKRKRKSSSQQPSTHSSTRASSTSESHPNAYLLDQQSNETLSGNQQSSPISLRPNMRTFSMEEYHKELLHQERQALANEQRDSNPRPTTATHRKSFHHTASPHSKKRREPVSKQKRKQVSSSHRVTMKRSSKKRSGAPAFVRSKDLHKMRVKPLYAWEKQALHNQSAPAATRNMRSPQYQASYSEQDSFIQPEHTIAFKLDDSDFEHLMSRRRSSMGFMETRKDFLRKGHGRLASEPGPPKRLLIDRRDGTSRHVIDVSKVPVRDLDGLYTTTQGPYLESRDMKGAHAAQKERWMSPTSFKTALKPMNTFPRNSSLPEYLNSGLEWKSGNIQIASGKIRETRADPEKRVGERDFAAAVRPLNATQVDKQYGMGMIAVHRDDE